MAQHQIRGGELRGYDSVSEACASIGQYLTFYNARRPMSLDGKTPIKLTSPRCHSLGSRTAERSTNRLEKLSGSGAYPTGGRWHQKVPASVNGTQNPEKRTLKNGLEVRKMLEGGPAITNWDSGLLRATSRRASKSDSKLSGIYYIMADCGSRSSAPSALPD